jgi:Mn-dependent DtxR family transcriptional regulator
MPIEYRPDLLPLSARQIELCQAIARHVATTGLVPTTRELAGAMDVHPSRIGQLVESTAAKGALKYEPRKPRTIQLTPKGIAATKPGKVLQRS